MNYYLQLLNREMELNKSCRSRHLINEKDQSMPYKIDLTIFSVL